MADLTSISPDFATDLDFHWIREVRKKKKKKKASEQAL